MGKTRPTRRPHRDPRGDVGARVEEGAEGLDVAVGRRDEEARATILRWEGR